jgi:hypothetical protein
MSDIDRRAMLRVLGAAPAAALAFTWTAEEAVEAAARSQEARQRAASAGQPYQPRFFNAHEYATMAMLSDLILPKDSRSGSASDAGAPEFIDYIVAEQPERQTAMRGGLAWLDAQCLQRFDQTFLRCADAQRTQVLDGIAWPQDARPEMSHGVRFFNTLRDLVATGFWSSEMGVKDLGYLGNTIVTEWKGAPPEVLQKLGVSYEE